MSDLFGNHIVGFPTRWLIYICIRDNTRDVFMVINWREHRNLFIHCINGVATHLFVFLVLSVSL